MLPISSVKKGDTVRRMLAGTIPMDVKVTDLTEEKILCGKEGDGWEFDRRTGAEIDDFLGWGAPPKMTGSFLAGVLEENEVN